MVDLITLVITAIIVIVTLLHRASVGVAILALLAGVSLDAILSSWAIEYMPSDFTDAIYVQVAVRMVICFLPVLIVLSSIKTKKTSPVLSLLCALGLGFLVVYFGLQVLEPIETVADEALKSGLYSFVRPYQNEILAISTILALAEIALSGQVRSSDDKKHKKSH